MVMADMMENVLELKNQTFNLQRQAVVCGKTAIQNGAGSGADAGQTGVSALRAREMDRVCGNLVLDLPLAIEAPRAPQ
jgi:hypothetical protein